MSPNVEVERECWDPSGWIWASVVHLVVIDPGFKHQIFSSPCTCKAMPVWTDQRWCREWQGPSRQGAGQGHCQTRSWWGSDVIDEILGSFYSNDMQSDVVVERSGTCHKCKYDIWSLIDFYHLDQDYCQLTHRVDPCQPQNGATPPPSHLVRGASQHLETFVCIETLDVLEKLKSLKTLQTLVLFCTAVYRFWKLYISHNKDDGGLFI